MNGMFEQVISCMKPHIVYAVCGQLDRPGLAVYRMSTGEKIQLVPQYWLSEWKQFLKGKNCLTTGDYKEENGKKTSRLFHKETEGDVVFRVSYGIDSTNTVDADWIVLL